MQEYNKHSLQLAKLQAEEHRSSSSSSLRYMQEWMQCGKYTQHLPHCSNKTCLIMHVLIIIVVVIRLPSSVWCNEYLLLLLQISKTTQGASKALIWWPETSGITRHNVWSDKDLSTCVTSNPPVGSNHSMDILFQLGDNPHHIQTWEDCPSSLWDWHNSVWHG